MSSLLRCFSGKRISRKLNPESSIALLVQGDDYKDDDQDHISKIREKRLFPNPGKSVARRFTWDDIERLKGYYDMPYNLYGRETVVDSAKMTDSNGVAFKFYGGERLRAYKNELEILIGLNHDNIVKLLGYCDDQEKGIFILEHIGHVSLRDKLHCISETSSPSRAVKFEVLPWKIRIKIAYQLIQAIEYLHEKCPQQIIHGDINPSHILLDDQLNCKLSNFGSAKMGSQSGLSRRKGRFNSGFPGYTDFHYISTALALKEHDIYSFGIILLELITGIEAPCLHSRGRVLSQADSLSRDKAILVKTMDPSLGLDFDSGEAMVMASIAAKCLNGSLSFRPSATNIVQEMRKSFRAIIV